MIIQKNRKLTTNHICVCVCGDNLKGDVLCLAEVPAGLRRWAYGNPKTLQFGN